MWKRQEHIGYAAGHIHRQCNKYLNINRECTETPGIITLGDKHEIAHSLKHIGQQAAKRM